MRAYIRLLIIAVFPLLSIHSYAEETIVIGDSAKTVLSVLGKPRGKMSKGKSEYWSYQRGVVRVTNGKVTYLNISSKDESQKKEARRRAALKAQAEASHEAAEAKKQKYQEARAIKKAKLNDEEFLKQPPKTQLSFWTDFQTKYPEINLSSVIKPLKKMVSPKSETVEKSDREILEETIESKQAELDDWIQKAKTTSAGRTWARRYHLARKELEETLVKLRKDLRAMPKEDPLPPAAR